MRVPGRVARGRTWFVHAKLPQRISTSADGPGGRASPRVATVTRERPSLVEGRLW
jgi:hypothetical protein